MNAPFETVLWTFCPDHDLPTLRIRTFLLPDGEGSYVAMWDQCRSCGMPIDSDVHSEHIRQLVNYGFIKDEDVKDYRWTGSLYVGMTLREMLDLPHMDQES